MTLRFAWPLSLSFCVATLLLLVSPVLRTDAVAAPPQNPTKVSVAFECKESLSAEALKRVLAAVQDSYVGVQSISADFFQDSSLAALSSSESSRGKVLFDKPGKMKWVYSEPEQQEFILDNRTVWLYQPEIRQVLIDELTKVLLSDLPVSFLMGVGDLASDFTLDGGCRTSLGTALVLRPIPTQGKEEQLKGFELLVDAKSRPSGARVTDAAGNVTGILLTDITINQKVPKDAFTPHFPEGTDVYDRRKAGSVK